MTQYYLFALAAALLALTPGPNTALTISRTAAGGWRAGLLVLLGVELGFLVHLFAAALGFTALLLAIPTAYDLLRIAGALYLLWIAVGMIIGRTRLAGGVQPSAERPARLIGLGFISNALNPKTAVFYLAVFPNFTDPAAGSVLAQSLLLGAVHITVSTLCNLVWVLTAGSLAGFLVRRPAWERAQRWLFGTLIGAFALKMLAERRHLPAAG